MSPAEGGRPRGGVLRTVGYGTMTKYNDLAATVRVLSQGLDDLWRRQEEDRADRSIELDYVHHLVDSRLSGCGSTWPCSAGLGPAAGVILSTVPPCYCPSPGAGVTAPLQQASFMRVQHVELDVDSLVFTLEDEDVIGYTPMDAGLKVAASVSRSGGRGDSDENSAVSVSNGGTDWDAVLRDMEG